MNNTKWTRWHFWRFLVSKWDIFVPFFLLLFLSDPLLMFYGVVCLWDFSVSLCICMCFMCFFFGFLVVSSYSILLSFIFIFIVLKRGQQSPRPVHLPFGTIRSRTAFVRALAFVTSRVEQNNIRIKLNAIRGYSWDCASLEFPRAAWLVSKELGGLRTGVRLQHHHRLLSLLFSVQWSPVCQVPPRLGLEKSWVVPAVCWWVAWLAVWTLNHLPTSLL